MENAERKRFFSSIFFPFLFVVLLWIIKGVEVQVDLDFSSYGILPGKVSGLRGILFSPFIHGDFNHLINNSFPLLILGTALFYFYRSIAFRIVFWSYLLAGFYTWIAARQSYHIGASGLVYALFGFILISGFIRRHIPLIAISFLVVFLYGSLIWGIFPLDQKVSWEGHFWGLFVGLILALYYRKQGPQRKKYQWEDELDVDENDDDEYAAPENKAESKLEVVYHFVPKEKQENSKK